MLFSERLAELRAAAKLSQTELAARARVGLATVKDYDGGRRSPSLELAQRLAKALGGRRCSHSTGAGSRSRGKERSAGGAG
jgi:transcriptional regulator with XRE-family HTH domain